MDQCLEFKSKPDCGVSWNVSLFHSNECSVGELDGSWAQRGCRDPHNDSCNSKPPVRSSSLHDLLESLFGGHANDNIDFICGLILFVCAFRGIDAELETSTVNDVCHGLSNMGFPSSSEVPAFTISRSNPYIESGREPCQI